MLGFEDDDDDDKVEDDDSVEMPPLPNTFGGAEGLPPNTNPVTGLVIDDTDDEEGDGRSNNVGQSRDGGRGTPKMELIDWPNWYTDSRPRWLSISFASCAR